MVSSNEIIYEQFTPDYFSDLACLLFPIENFPREIDCVYPSGDHLADVFCCDDGDDRYQEDLTRDKRDNRPVPPGADINTLSYCYHLTTH